MIMVGTRIIQQEIIFTRKAIHNTRAGETALKPAHEPIVLARKPLSEKSVADNVLKHETGGINIDGCRIELSEGENIILGEVKMAKDVYVGGYAGKDTKSNELGRFPANVMHDGLQEEWSRYFYCPKVSSAERNRGLENFEPKPMAWGNQAKAELKEVILILW